jgi:hypothetical protein
VDSTWTFVVRQVPVLLLADAVYVAIRAVIEGSPGRSEANARVLLGVERALGLDWERGIQDVVLDHDRLVAAADFVYVWAYWPFVFSGLALVHLLDRPRYVRLRNALFVAGGVGCVVFATIPVAPPRFMPGYVGTVSDAARSHHISGAPRFVNRYAALPSFHAGWTLLVSLVLASCLASRWARAVALVPGTAMSFAVVATGNHYVVDVVAGHAICLGAFAVVGAWGAAPPAVAAADP